MNQFNEVRKALNGWFSSIPWMNAIMPYSLYIAFGALGVDFIDRFTNVVFHEYFLILNVLDTIAYWGIFVGALLLLVSPHVKYVPYLFFGKMLVILFPFSNFYITTLISAAVYAYLGYLSFTFSALETDEVTQAS
ncbi:MULTISPECIES: hypothetical protein [Pontibacillus]|uniref:Uncharacterized protein n=1 Tax=Pontibacillus chungwhensis TaxID=265426 RepID=A0ABY8UWA1_9BACI|nr:MULTISPECIES: hypothetical protein [Pontibacillus]MCD5324182.1 hypothetical protein [Pontibacillus sp. HN14]WIF97759.1 hypothetical protein QNI29_18855 [Pontibacillus chungwhensis]